MPRENRTSQGNGINVQSTKARQAGGITATLQGQANIHSGIAGLAEGLKGVLDLGSDVMADLKDKANKTNVAEAEADFFRNTIDKQRMIDSHKYKEAINKAELSRDSAQNSLEIEKGLNQRMDDGEIDNMTDWHSAYDEQRKEFFSDEDGTLTDRYGDVSNYAQSIQDMGKDRASAIRTAFNKMGELESEKLTVANRGNMYDAFDREIDPILQADAAIKSGMDGLRNMPRGELRQAGVTQFEQVATNLALENSNTDMLQGLIDAKHDDGQMVLDTAGRRRVAKTMATVKKNMVAAKEEARLEGLRTTKIYTEAQMKADADRGIFDHTKVEHNKTLDISDEYQRSMMAHAYTESIKAGKDGLNRDAFIRGDGWIVDKKDRQDGFDTVVAEDGRTMEQVINLSNINTMLPTRIKDRLTMSGLIEPEKFHEDYQLYQTFRSQAQEAIDQNLSLETRTKFEVYGMLIDNGTEPSIAAGVLRDSDPEVEKRFYTEGGATKVSRETILGDLENAGTQFFDADVSQASINEVVKLSAKIFGTGMYDTIDEAREQATNLYMANAMVIDGRVFPNTKGVPNANVDEWTDYTKQQMVPEGQDPDDWMLMPMPSKRGQNLMKIMPRNGQWVTNDSTDFIFDAQEMASGYKSKRHADMVTEREELATKYRREAMKAIGMEDSRTRSWLLAPRFQSAGEENDYSEANFYERLLKLNKGSVVETEAEIAGMMNTIVARDKERKAKNKIETAKGLDLAMQTGN